LQRCAVAVQHAARHAAELVIVRSDKALLRRLGVFVLCDDASP